MENGRMENWNVLIRQFDNVKILQCANSAMEKLNGGKVEGWKIGKLERRKKLESCHRFLTTNCTN
jgi:hypothetical protein